MSENVLYNRRAHSKSYERRNATMKSGSLYGWGLFLTVFGGAGLAEVITSNRGSFMVSAVIFALGFGMILVSYTIHDD